jgi:glycosyltransferase involved in cell wall biosynthesis
MNVLFVLYHDFSANSAIHVHNFANQLAQRQHLVAVAVPGNKETGSNLGAQLYSTLTFSEWSGGWRGFFANDRPPDVVHAWTPRENVRLFCEKLSHDCSFNLFVHLEDNEEIILEVNLGTSFSKLAEMPSVEIPLNLSHPRRHRELLQRACGITIIMDRLEKFVPAGIPRLVLWPGADPKLFRPQPKDELLLARLGIPVNSTILCYTGNVHPVNAREVRSLYLAVAMLNREGMPTTLLRAGRDYCPFLGADERWARKYAVELGYVKHIDIPRLLSLGDALIQPGMDDVFNEYRLPSKLPEFFAMGRPIILPHTNVGRFVNHGEHAWVIPKVDALGIVESLQRVLKDEALTKVLSEGAQRFCREHFDWETNASKLDAFYHTVLHEQQSRSKSILPYVEESGSTRLEISDVSPDLQELPEVNHASQS